MLSILARWSTSVSRTLSRHVKRSKVLRDLIWEALSCLVLHSNSIACKTIPFYISEKAVHSPTIFLHNTFQVQYRECSDKCSNTGSTSQVSKFPVSQLLFFVFNMAESGLFWGILSSDKNKTSSFSISVVSCCTRLACSTKCPSRKVDGISMI